MITGIINFKINKNNNQTKYDKETLNKVLDKQEEIISSLSEYVDEQIIEATTLIYLYDGGIDTSNAFERIDTVKGVHDYTKIKTLAMIYLTKEEFKKVEEINDITIKISEFIPDTIESELDKKKVKNIRALRDELVSLSDNLKCIISNKCRNILNLE